MSCKCGSELTEIKPDTKNMRKCKECLKYKKVLIEIMRLTSSRNDCYDLHKLAKDKLKEGEG